MKNYVHDWVKFNYMDDKEYIRNQSKMEIL